MVGYAQQFLQGSTWSSLHWSYRLAMPTLVIAGRHDPATPLEANEYISSNVAGAKLTVLDAAHMSNVEQRDAYTEAVLGFLLAR